MNVMQDKRKFLNHPRIRASASQWWYFIGRFFHVVPHTIDPPSPLT
jgi:hypothetical protein